MVESNSADCGDVKPSGSWLEAAVDSLPLRIVVATNFFLKLPRECFSRVFCDLRVRCMMAALVRSSSLWEAAAARIALCSTDQARKRTSAGTAIDAALVAAMFVVGTTTV